MKFEKSVGKKYKNSIKAAFDTIEEKGNKFHRYMVRTIRESDMLICCYPVSKVNASGITGVINPEKTNKRIRKKRMDLYDAFEEIFITIAEETIDTGGQRGCEGTFVHEGRHAYDFARMVSSFSNADLAPDEVFNPTLYELEWEAHKTAGEYMLQMSIDEYLSEGVQLMILGESNGECFLDDDGIKRRLQKSYNLNEMNQGVIMSEMLGLQPRA